MAWRDECGSPSGGNGCLCFPCISHRPRGVNPGRSRDNFKAHNACSEKRMNKDKQDKQDRDEKNGGRHIVFMLSDLNENAMNAWAALGFCDSLYPDYPVYPCSFDAALKPFEILPWTFADCSSFACQLSPPRLNCIRSK